tara:strand:- start:333 stop:704 length:372 start_codon:yes stop_codon:yes gene_type:complete
MTILNPIKSSIDGFLYSIKSLSFLLLFSGIILFVVGYVREENFSRPEKVVYRYIPRSFKEEQENPTPIMSIYSKMFSKSDPWHSNRFYQHIYPWQNQSINSEVVTAYNNPKSGFGKHIGFSIN